MSSSALIVCRLARLAVVTGGDVGRAEALFVSGEPPSLGVQSVLYAFAGLSGAAGVLAGVNLLVRGVRGSCWLFRSVPTPYGSYWSPNASAMFSVASLLMSLIIELIIASAMILWRGRLLKGYILINTLGWLPLWTVGGVSTVWGTAVASLSLSRSRRIIAGAAPVPDAKPSIPPAAFNVAAVLGPLLVCIAIPALFALAQSSFDDALVQAQLILQALSTSWAASVGTADPCTMQELSALAEAGARLLDSNEKAMRLARAGFAVWTAAILALLLAWLPFQLATYSVLRRQLRRADRICRQDRRRCARPSNSYTQFPERTLSLDNRGAPQSEQDHLINMRGTYRSIIGEAAIFAAMILSYAALATLALVSPAAIIRGRSNRVLLLTSVGVFSTLGLLGNAVNLWRSFSTRSIVHPMPSHTSGKASSSILGSPTAPGTASRTFEQTRDLITAEPWLDDAWNLAADAGRRARNLSTITRLSA